MKLISLLLLICTFTTGFSMNEKIIYGYVEKATLLEKNFSVSAKLDTGAKTASLSAIDIEELERDGKTYLSFTVPDKDTEARFTCEYVGQVRIKVRAAEKAKANVQALRRPVVLMKIRIGDQERTIPVNLTNRKRFIYPLLLGRDAIKAFSGIIDPSQAFTASDKASNTLIK